MRMNSEQAAQSKAWVLDGDPDDDTTGIVQVDGQDMRAASLAEAKAVLAAAGYPETVVELEEHVFKDLITDETHPALVWVPHPEAQ